MKKTILLLMLAAITTVGYSQELKINAGTTMWVGDASPESLYTGGNVDNDGTLTFAGSSNFYVDAGLDNSTTGSEINFGDATLHIGSGDAVRSVDGANLIFKDRTLAFQGTNIGKPDIDATAYDDFEPGDVVRFVVLNKTGTKSANVTGGHLGITDNITLTSGELNGETTVTLLNRNATDAAQVAESTGGTARIEVERFMSQRRAFRLFAPGVTSSQNLRAQLQEEATAYNDNPAPGFGTHITGVAPEPDINADVSLDGTNGLDWQPSGDASSFVWNEVNQRWDPLLNTLQTTTFTSPYRVMVRGNREIDLVSNATAPGVTILRTRGELAQGDIDIPLASGAEAISLVANPYASRVNFANIATTADIDSYIAVWDATINARGGFVSVLASNGSLGAAPDPSGSTATNILEPGQSFFVLNSETVSDNILNFTEANKSIGSPSTGIFSTANFLNLRLETTEEDLVIDGLGFRFNDAYNVEANGQDAAKFENPNTNFAIINGGSLLYIDNRPAPSNETIVPLMLTGHNHENYQIVPSFNLDGLDMEVYLKDNYLDELTAIEDNQPINFSIDESVPGSVNPYRFQIVFNPTPLSVDEITEGTFTMYPNPAESQVSIMLPSNASQNNWNVSLYTINGQLINTWKHENVSGSIDLNVENLRTGVYLIELGNDEQKSVQKLIKK